MRADSNSRISGLAGETAIDVAPTTRHPHEYRGDHQDRGDSRRDEEASVDRRHARPVRGARRHGEDADNRGDHADGGDHERKNEAQFAERSAAENQCGNQDHRVGLEEVGGHACAVTDVVANVVRNRCCVTRIVLGNVLLHLADEICTDIGGLREDAATDTHKHGQKRGTKAEALQHLGGLSRVDENDKRGTEQAQTDGEHSCHATGAEGDAHGALLSCILGGRGYAHVASYGQPHAHVARDSGEHRAHEEEDAAADAFGVCLRWE